MSGQPPLIWDRAEGFQIYDPWGNYWVDWSSGVLITNVGHGHPRITQSLERMLQKPLLTTYVFAHESRAALCELLLKYAPDPQAYRVFLLTTGSEAIENCIKLAKTYALEKYGRERTYLISFKHAFHGRTMGAQLAGGMDGQKRWIIDEGRTFIQVPFPDGYKNEYTHFDGFLEALSQQGIDPHTIAGVLTESYQGVGPDFLPVTYAQRLQEFCRAHDIVMIYDEVQAGFGRTGTMFAYEHYGVKPDLIACGKGISSSLPLSAVIGRSDIMDRYPPGSMTSTHSGNPLAVAAAVENLRILEEENLVTHAANVGTWFLSELKRIQKKYASVLGCLHGKGLVAGIQAVQSQTKEPNPELAWAINERCFQKGLLMFAPVGIAGECIKIAPPLCITREALEDSLQAFEEACDEVINL